MTGPQRPLVTARAPAKVNLSLAVGARRADGYHELRGVFARLALADELSVQATGSPAAEGGDMLRMRPGTAGVDAGDDLALKAARALRSWAGRPLPRLSLTIQKRIPVAAGLGGGSSDAAAALRLASAAWGLDVPAGDLAGIALALGSDVPFFLGESPVALVGGRGERVDPLPAAGIAGVGVVLVCGQGKPSTAEIFAAFDSHANAVRRPQRDAGAASAATDRLVAFLRAEPDPARLAEFALALRDANDLYPSAISVTPGLAELRDRIEEVLQRPALLSGAGPALFVLYPSAEEVREAVGVLRTELASRPIEAGPARPPRLIATAIAAEGEISADEEDA